MNEYRKLIIKPNKLVLPDGRTLARYYPILGEWEIVKWHYNNCIGRYYTKNECNVINKAILEGCWVDCLECEKARFMGENL